MEVEPTIKLKRGRKSKKELLELSNSINGTCACPESCPILQIDETLIDNYNVKIEEQVSEELNKSQGKKRGRKPKGGKIVKMYNNLYNNEEPCSNIILHLKCSLKDLELNELNTNIESYKFKASKTNLNYDMIDNNTGKQATTTQQIDVEHKPDTDDNYNSKDTEQKEIFKKLKELEHNLHTNNISDKKSSCFWCTYDFDNPSIYIPKYLLKDTYHVYGCFCSPECGVAFLMEENIDSSTKFERYYLLNHIYSKIYNYKKSIKPSPNPYYMLDKYYGNLTIQEYRSLLKNERLFFVVDKPLTRILPELHEDNDDFLIHNKVIPSNTYIKKRCQKVSKNNIVNENFGPSNTNYTE
jgi:hypothetical protein